MLLQRIMPRPLMKGSRKAVVTFSADVPLMLSWCSADVQLISADVQLVSGGVTLTAPTLSLRHVANDAHCEHLYRPVE